MDWATIGLSVLLGAVVQTTIIVVLYNHYIIPHIITGVKDELMVSIKGWVDGMTAELSNKIGAEITDKMLSLKRSIAGKRGRQSQLLAAAQSYLNQNLTDDVLDDSPEYQDIVTEAIATYGKPIIDSLIAKMRPTKQVVDTTEAVADGW